MEETSSNLLNTYNNVRSGIAAWLGVIITVVGVVVIFVVASLEGTKEVKASGAVSAKIMEMWREANPEQEYPKEMGELIPYQDKEYYFVVKKYVEGIDFVYDDNGELVTNDDGVPLTTTVKIIDKWYFAYDGGMDYVFRDKKFYVLTALTIVISLYVSNINYVSTRRTVMGSSDFVNTLRYYKEKKDKIENHTQYIPDFCTFKNKQAYETAKREIIEDAGINYKAYNSESFDADKLEDWQKKRLKKIAKIKVKKIHASDLLQEQGHLSTNITLLPMSQREHQKNFLIGGAVQKTITSALSGMIVAFGVVMGNWFLGITYGLTVLISYVSSVIIATDFVQSTLRNRYIAKGDLLNEFDNIKKQFIVEEEHSQ